MISIAAFIQTETSNAFFLFLLLSPQITAVTVRGRKGALRWRRRPACACAPPHRRRASRARPRPSFIISRESVPRRRCQDRPLIVGAQWTVELEVAAGDGAQTRGPDAGRHHAQGRQVKRGRLGETEHMQSSGQIKATRGGPAGVSEAPHVF